MQRILLITLALYAKTAAAPVVKVTPASLSFSYQLGQSALPVPQVLNVAPVTGGAVLAVAIAASGGPWIAVSPSTGRTPLTARVVVNPTGLPDGSYSGSVTVTSAGEAVSVPVTLTIKRPPPSLTVSPTALAFTWVRGDPPPAPQTLNFTTSGALLSFTASASGANWFTLTPASGLVFPAFVTSLKAAVNPEGLDPGSYKTSIGISAPDAANKTQTVNATLTVQPGKPAIDSLWPAAAPMASNDTTITITGSNFYSGTTVRVNGIIGLRPVVIGSTVMTVVLPASMLDAAQALSITVMNPQPGGGVSPAKLFNVLPSSPRIAAVVDAASFLVRPVAPGQLVTVFGSGIGPDQLVTFSTPLVGIIYTRLAGVQVLFDGLPAPILYVLHNQVGAVVPYAVAGRSETRVKIDYAGLVSPEVTVPLADQAPGIFTATATGKGQAAVFNVDMVTGALSLNSESNPAAKGSAIVIYATGEGVPNPPVVDGLIAVQPSSVSNPSVKVEIGGAETEVLYAGAAPGLVVGVMQINAKIPTSLTVSRTTPLVVKIGTASSQPGVTVAIK